MTDPIRVLVEATVDSLEPDSDGEVGVTMTGFRGGSRHRYVDPSTVHVAPPVWATQPDDGYYTTIEKVREHKLEWKLYGDGWCSWDKDTRGVMSWATVVAREPARQTAAEILDEIEEYSTTSEDPTPAHFFTDYRAALEAEQEKS